MNTATRAAVQLRYAELFLKGANRSRFDRRLIQNIEAVLEPFAQIHVRRERTHAVVECDSNDLERVEAALHCVFGIASIARGLVCERSLEAVTGAAIALLRLEISRRQTLPSFKVETQRSDKQFPLTSLEISRHVGGAINRELALPVDVHNPILTVRVSLSTSDGFASLDKRSAQGGLPAGSAGRVQLLLSGGIDSPVAGWLMLKRGCEIEATYFHAAPYVGEGSKAKVVDLARELSRWQQSPVRLNVVAFAETQKALRALDSTGRLAVVLYRRMMLRVASAIAQKSNCQALITGEALAQVASQTLTNLAVIDEAAQKPVLRPCIGHNKLETIRIAEQIGTFPISILPYDDCCSLFVPAHPETSAQLSKVEEFERKIDIAEWVNRCVDGREIISCYYR